MKKCGEIHKERQEKLLKDDVTYRTLFNDVIEITSALMSNSGPILSVKIEERKDDESSLMDFEYEI